MTTFFQFYQRSLWRSPGFLPFWQPVKSVTLPSVNYMTPKSPFSTSYSIHHVGIAVESAQLAVETHQKKFGGDIIDSEILADRGLSVIFLSTQTTMLEFISPLDSEKTNQSNTITKFLSKRGSGLHHICYEVPDIKAELIRLTNQGVALIDQSPRTGAMNTLIAFLKPEKADGMLIELCQKIKN